MPSLKESAQEYARGIGGGLLFALPILYTREIWHTGFLVGPLRLALSAAGTFALLVGFNRVAGLRENASWTECVVDSVEEYGLGLLVAGLVFLATGRIGPGVPLVESLNLLVVGSVSTALGVSIGTAQLGENPEREGVGAGLAGQLLVALCGAVIVAANIAPTQEVLTMALETGAPALLGLVAGTLSLIWAASSSGLKGGAPLSESPPVPTKLFSVVGTYGLAAATSAAFLLLFGRYDGLGLAAAVRATAVLTAPAALGAAVGRALIQA